MLPNDLLNMFDDSEEAPAQPAHITGLPSLDDFFVGLDTPVASNTPISNGDVARPISSTPIPPSKPMSKAEAFWSDRSMTKADGTPVRQLPGMTLEQSKAAKKLLKDGSMGISELRSIVGEVDGISTYDLNAAAELFVPHRLRVAPPKEILDEARKEFMEKRAAACRQEIADGNIEEGIDME